MKMQRTIVIANEVLARRLPAAGGKAGSNLLSLQIV
jgi:uncharacterized protein (DUF342 family)